MKSSNAEKLTIFKKKFGKKDFFTKLIVSLGRFFIKINPILIFHFVVVQFF